MHRRAKLPSREKGVSLGSPSPRGWGITESRADTAALGSGYPPLSTAAAPIAGGGKRWIGRPHAERGSDGRCRGAVRLVWRERGRPRGRAQPLCEVAATDRRVGPVPPCLGGMGRDGIGM
jgi:hypothetical protein